jgi:hypothetical protein
MLIPLLWAFMILLIYKLICNIYFSIYIAKYKPNILQSYKNTTLILILILILFNLSDFNFFLICLLLLFFNYFYFYLICECFINN